MKSSISDKLQKIYAFMLEYLDSNGFPPSVREIGAKCNIKSTATVYDYLEKLKQQGLLVKSPSKKRALQVVGNKRDFYPFHLLAQSVLAHRFLQWKI